VADVEVVTTSDGLAALADDWRALWARTPTARFCESFEWHWNAWDFSHQGTTSRPLIAVVRASGRVALILPLIVDRHAGLHRGRWLGARVAFYEGALVDRDAPQNNLLRLAWEALRVEGRLDYVTLENVPEGSDLDRLLQDHPGRFHERRPVHSVQWNDWVDWDDYWQSRRRRLRQDQGRQWRRLEAIGPVRFSGRLGGDDVADVIDWVIERKLEWMQRLGKRTGWFGERIVPFFRASVQDANRMGRLYVGQISVGGQTVAAEVGLADPGAVVAAVTTYAEKWRAYSPGRLLDERSVRWSLENGFPGYDFLTGTSQAEILHKSLWAEPRQWSSAYVIPFTGAGRAYVRWFSSGTRRQIRSAYTRWPELRRRLWLPGDEAGIQQPIE